MKILGNLKIFSTKNKDCLTDPSRASRNPKAYCCVLRSKKQFPFSECFRFRKSAIVTLHFVRPSSWPCVNNHQSLPSINLPYFKKLRRVWKNWNFAICRAILKNFVLVIFKIGQLEFCWVLEKFKRFYQILWVCQTDPCTCTIFILEGIH